MSRAKNLNKDALSELEAHSAGRSIPTIGKRRKMHGTRVRVGFLECLSEAEAARLRPGERFLLENNPLASTTDLDKLVEDESAKKVEESGIETGRSNGKGTARSRRSSASSKKGNGEKSSACDNDVDGFDNDIDDDTESNEDSVQIPVRAPLPTHRHRIILIDPDAYAAAQLSTPASRASLVSTPASGASFRSKRRRSSSSSLLKLLNDGNPSSKTLTLHAPPTISPLERFRTCAKKVLWRIRQRTKALQMLQRGQAKSPGGTCVLRGFGSSGAVVNSRNVTIENLLTIYCREIGFRRKRVISREDVELWLWHPRIGKRERIVTDIYLRCVLGQRLESAEERKVGSIHRIFSELGRECCGINGKAPDPERLALALWQFCWGPDFEYHHLLTHGNLLQALLEDGVDSPTTYLALWSMCEKSSKLREILIMQLGAVEIALERFHSSDSLVGLLATFTCCDSGLQHMLEGRGVNRLLNLCCCDDEQVSPRMKALIVTTLTSCWPRSLTSLRTELQHDAHARCFDFLLGILEVSSKANESAGSKPVVAIQMSVEDILKRVPAMCLLSQLGEANPCHSSFVTDRVMGMVTKLGMAAYLARSDKTYANKVIYLDVFLQACCCAIKSWVEGCSMHGRSPAEPELMALLRNVFHTQSSLNQVKATHALLEVFKGAHGDGVDPKLDQLVLSKLRLCHSNQEISKAIFAKAFNTPECCERLNRHGALVVVLNMMRHYVKTKEGLALASKAALNLAMAPNVQNFSVSLMLQLLQTSRGDSRNALLCVLYGVLTSSGAVADDAAHGLASHPETYEIMGRVLASLAGETSKPMFEVTLLTLWHINSRFDRPDKELDDLANSLIGHLLGNNANLRRVISRARDFETDRGLDSRALLNVSFEKEVQMWTAVSFKRSFLETTTLIPRSLRTASSIIGYYETQRDAVDAFVKFENIKEKIRNKYLLPSLDSTSDSNSAQESPKVEATRERKEDEDETGTATQGGARCETEDINPDVDPRLLKETTEAVRARTRLLLASIADLFRISKERLVSSHKARIAKKKDEFKLARERRAERQEKSEISLELDEIPIARLNFRRLERLQRANDMEKLRDLARSHSKEESNVHAMLNSKEIVCELFFVGFCNRFDSGAKETVLWLLWELLFERRYVNELKIDDAEEGLHLDDVYGPELPDAQEEEEKREEEEAAAAAAGVSEDEAEEEEEDDYSDDSSSDEEGAGSDVVRGQAATKVETEREKWQKKSFLFGRQTIFYETRFASLLTAMAKGAAEAQNVSLELCAARLFMRLAMLFRDTSTEGVSAIAKVNGIECLLELLRSKTPEVQHCAALALRQLSLSRVHQEIMSIGGGFGLLLRFGSAPEGHLMTKRTQDVVREILVPLRKHPCNGTRLYQAEMKGMQSELIKRPSKKLSFYPAIKDIDVSSTPRTKGAYKVQLLPLLFQDEYSADQQQQVLQLRLRKQEERQQQLSRVGGLQTKSVPQLKALAEIEEQTSGPMLTANRRKSNNHNEADPEQESLRELDCNDAVESTAQDSQNRASPMAAHELDGPIFTFFPSSDGKVSSNTKRFSFQGYLNEDPKTRDEYWDKMLAKFDKHTVRRPLHDAPAFEAPDGQQFFLCLKASVPPLPVAPERARVFEERLSDLLVPIELDALCGLRGVTIDGGKSGRATKSGADSESFQANPEKGGLENGTSKNTPPAGLKSNLKIAALTMFCYMGEEGEEKRPVDDVMTTSVRSTTMGVSAGPPTRCESAHPLLGYLGRQLGKVLDQESDNLQLFFVSFDPDENSQVPQGQPRRLSQHRAAHLFQGEAAQTLSASNLGTSSSFKKSKAQHLSVAQSMLIKEFEPNDHWSSVDRDRECVSSDLYLQFSGKSKLFSKNQGDQARDRVAAIMAEHASLLVSAFRFYAVDQSNDHTHAEEFESIGMLQQVRFMKLLSDCKVPGHNESLTRQRYELAFKSVISHSPARNPEAGSKGETLVNKLQSIKVINLNKHSQALLRSEFLECILRCAIIAYGEHQSIKVPPEDALSTLIQDHIVPLLGHEALLTPNHFSINRFHTPRVMDVLLDSVDLLRDVFDSFAGKSHATNPWGGCKGKRMALPDWYDAAGATVGSVIQNMPRNTVAKAFALSLRNIRDPVEHWRSAFTLDFASFLEAIARLADMLNMPEDSDLEVAKVRNTVDFYSFLRDTDFFKEDEFASELRGSEVKAHLSFDSNVGIGNSAAQSHEDPDISSDSKSISSLNLSPDAPPQQGKGALGDQLEKLVSIIQHSTSNLSTSDFATNGNALQPNSTAVAAWLQDNASAMVKHVATSISKRDDSSLELVHVVDARQAYAMLRGWISSNGYTVITENLSEFVKEIGGADTPRGKNIMLAKQILDVHLPDNKNLRR